MSAEVLRRFLGMPAVWTPLLAWVCIWFSAQAHGALSSSRGDALKQVEVYSVRMDCIITSRFAHTVTTSKARNIGNTSQEFQFDMELPKTAFITNFTMVIDGVSYAGEVKEKEKAKKQFDKAVSLGQTAGLVKVSGRKMEKFSVSVNVAANSSATFILIYEELLQRKLGKYEFFARIKMDQPVEDFEILAHIHEPQGISFVEATATLFTNDLHPLVVKTVSHTSAHIHFSPTVEQQMCPGCESSSINGDFIITYDVNRDEKLGEFQAANGYFVHFFSPPDLARVPKNVVFVNDISGSMGGTKIAQTRDAMVAILNDLHEEDHFAIILFDSRIITWRKTLTKATKENVVKAIDYVKKIEEKGSTNINAAVLKAVNMLKKERLQGNLPERSADMIILLTDGMPNHGVSVTSVIQHNVQTAIGGNMSLFSLGFGNNVAYSFLNVLSKQNNGLARRIYEASDAVLQLQGFYEEVSSPLLLEVDLRYPDNEVDQLTQNHHSQLFNGSEIVVAGQLKNDMNNFIVEVLAQGPEEDFQVKGRATAPDWNIMYPHQNYIYGDFIERLWAYLTIQQLLEKSESSTQHEKASATAKALEMSLRYSFVTPLTSMVVTKPETEDGADNSFIADKLTEDQRQKAEQQRGSVASFQSTHHTKQRQQQQQQQQQAQSSSGSRPHGGSNVDGDPHFLIEFPDKNDAVCFNVNDKPGTIFNLVTDPESGFVVNGQTIGKKKKFSDSIINTYFGRFGIVHQNLGVKVEVSTQDILIFNEGKIRKLLWSDSSSLKDTNVSLRLSNNYSLTVTLRHSVKFMIVRHTKVWKRRHEQQAYLGFYTLDSHHLSAATHGLLGQFYKGLEFEIDDLNQSKVQEKLNATLYVKGQALSVTRHWQKDFSRDVEKGESISCWFVDNEGSGLVDGTISDYIVKQLFGFV
ncbi:inter-alpha-trypsin inhibitor heavy chain H3-like [Gouania willdenowi]|uniref:inter-alpha-trypsin inhibitor heavy chain H3-like n=1 Tax=Gouania willdenowi TaxID=441366 RepID=UPI0010569CBB|nr:inter-alpha-trypsin inhibitor heavy chain H3-like [Gouania willdenowi]